MRIHRLAQFAQCIMASATGGAQTVDIGLFPGDLGGQVEVRLRSTVDFDGIISNLVYTVRWPAVMGAVVQEPDALSHCPAGIPLTMLPEGINGDYRYRIFTASGVNQLADVCPAQVLYAGTDVVIQTIFLSGGVDSCYFRIAHDAFTSAADVDYFISLNGNDATGVIYSNGCFIADVQERFANANPVLFPNPSCDVIRLSDSSGASGARSWSILAADRRVVMEGRGPLPTAGLNVSGLPNGSYLLRLDTTLGSSYERFIKLDRD